jgi:hypothetical protein
LPVPPVIYNFIADLLFLSEVPRLCLVAGAPCVHPYLGFGEIEIGPVRTPTPNPLEPADPPPPPPPPPPAPGRFGLSGLLALAPSSQHQHQHRTPHPTPTPNTKQHPTPTPNTQHPTTSTTTTPHTAHLTRTRTAAARLSKFNQRPRGCHLGLSKGILRKKHTSSGANPPGVSLNRLELKKQMRYFFRAKIFCVLQKNVLGKFLA